MHRASRAELLVYALVVAAAFVPAIRDTARLSSAAVPVLVRTAGTSQLPVYLSSILSTDSNYLRASYANQLKDLRLPAAADTRSNHLQPVLHVLSYVPGLGAVVKGIQYLSSLPRDVSDVQWRQFRASLALLAAGMVAYVLLSRSVRRLFGQHVWVLTSVALALGFQGVLHGAQAAWPLLLALGNYGLAHLMAGRRFGPLVMWLLHVAALVYIRFNNGLYFASISTSLSWLDQQGGMLRWHIHHNLALLRMLSFSLDLHWAKQGTSSSSSQLSKQDMAERNHVLGAGLLKYLMYCFYPPLYIAGPIITFGSFVTQAATGFTRVPNKQVVQYTARWLAALAILELMTRTLYCNALAKYGLLTNGLLASHGVHVSPVDFAFTGFWVLVFMWLKFLVIWRFARCVALADGLDPPENMRRCVCNNYSVQGFWQGWHCSYNRWLVRYLYVPLGGASWRLLNVWPVFLFVALWHDLELRLLAWGLLMPAAFLPEVAVRAVGSSKLLAPYKETWLFRQVAALFATANILALMCANLVGFVVGPAGLLPLLQQSLGRPAMAVAVIGTLFCAAQLMFAIRGWEDDHKKNIGSKDQQERTVNSLYGTGRGVGSKQL